MKRIFIVLFCFGALVAHHAPAATQPSATQQPTAAAQPSAAAQSPAVQQPPAAQQPSTAPESPAALQSPAAAPEPLTLDRCRALGRAHYPEIRQYDLIRRSTEFTLSNARRAYLPQLSFSAQATWQTSVADFPSDMGIVMPGMKKDQYKLALDLDQPLWDGGKSRADKLIATAAEAESLRATDVDIYALDGRVDDLFFGIMLFDARIDQTRLSIDLLRSNLDKLNSMLRNGVAMQSDADAVEAELLTVNQQLTSLESSRDSYRLMLSIFIGRDLGAARLECQDAAMPPASMTTGLARPEMDYFDARSNNLAAQESLVKASTRPRLSIFAQGFYGYPGLNFMEAMMTSSWTWDAVVGVRMSWNFGGYYTRKNSLQKLRVAQQQVEVQRDIFLFNNQLESTQERGEIDRLRRALADDDRIVALRRSVREAAESKLRGGVIDTNDLLAKITEERAAATARSGREIELLKAIYELKHTINQ